MSYKSKLIKCFVVLLLLGVTSAGWTARKPLEKPIIKIEVKPSTREWIGVDPKTKEDIYLPSAEAKVEFNPKTGNYIFSWRGYDGTRKSVVYEPATKIDVIIKAKAEYNPATKRYRYNYEIDSLKSSLQEVESFVVEYGTPVVKASFPSGWYSETFKYKPAWNWAAASAPMLKPENSLKGFSFESKGLPGIVDCYARGHAKESIWPEEPPQEIEESIPKHFENIVSGKTIGPVSPPGDFDSFTFTATLSSLLRESISLGWIDEEVAKSLEEKIKNVASIVSTTPERFKELEAAGVGNPRELYKEARDTLLAFIEEVEAQEDKHVTSEAVSLLALNAQYLLDNVKKPISVILIVLIIGGAVLIIVLVAFLFIRTRRKKKATTT